MGRFSKAQTQISLAGTKLTVLAAAMLLVLNAAPVRAEFLLSPLRQVITPENRVAVYEISNPSARTLETKISWIDLRATPEGYVMADADLRERLSAAPYLIVSPTILTLEPGARETVTVTLRDDARLPRGERRSHLLIESKAVRSLLRKAGGGVQLDLETAISTPVILRRGPAGAKAKIISAKLLRNNDGALQLETIIKPRSDFSAYGSVKVDYKAENGAPEVTLARLENVAAYPEAAQRRLELALNTARLESGVLTIRYMGEAEYSGVVFSERIFKIKPPKP